MDLIALGVGTPITTGIQQVHGDESLKKTLLPSISTNTIFNLELSPQAIASRINLHVSTTLVVRRTISWEKMLVVGPSDWTSTIKSNRNKSKSDEEEDPYSARNESEEMTTIPDPQINNHPIMGGTYLTWSPDGRAIAVGSSHGHVLLLDVEVSANPGFSPTAVHCLLPPPPLADSCAVDITIDKLDKHKDIVSTIGRKINLNSVAANTVRRKKAVSSKTRNISPVVTRSMTSARRKRILRMMGQTPHEKDDGDYTSIDGNNHSRINSSHIFPRPSSSLSTFSTCRTNAKKPTAALPSNTNHISTTIPDSTIATLRRILGRKISSSITAMKWQRLLPRHARWTSNQREVRDEEQWNIQRKYLDRGVGWFLPPSVYNPQQSFVVTGDSSSAGRLHSRSHFGGEGWISSTNSGQRRPLENYGFGIGSGGNMIGGSVATEGRYQPQCQTPLSILCVATVANGLHLYLHGKYRILTLPSPVCLSNTTTSILCASDLTSVLLYSVSPVVAQHIVINNQNEEEDNCKWTHTDGLGNDVDESDGRNHENDYIRAVFKLYLLPALASDRKLRHLQILSASYASISSHLSCIRNGMVEVSKSWNSSLRQLDAKFDHLASLLTKCNVLKASLNATSTAEEEVRTQLLNYILMGTQLGKNSSGDKGGGASNAMDQFFTHGQMNDQLLRQMERSLQSSTVDLEGVVRSKMLAPIRALVYDAMELRGIATAEKKYGKMKESILQQKTCQKLCEAAQVLWVVIEHCASHVVEIRFRLSDLVRWMRGTASQVRARGTDSVQRKNARKRRVEEGAVRRVVEFLSAPLNGIKLMEGYKGENKDFSSCKRGMTECILGVLLSDYFTKEKVCTPIHRGVTSAYCNTLLENRSNRHDGQLETPSVKAALKMCENLANEVFEYPRTIMSRSLHDLDILVEECIFQPYWAVVTAVHSRLGEGEGEEQPNITIEGENDFKKASSWFAPKNLFVEFGKELCNKFYQSRHWTIIANVCSSLTANNEQMIQITALPVGRGERVENDEEDDTFLSSTRQQSSLSFYLTTFVTIPEHCRVTSMSFYGNDGNSTITAETSQSTEEGIQAFGLLLERNLLSSEENGGEGEQKTKIAEELLVFHYDDLDYRVVPFLSCKNTIHIHKFEETVDVVRSLFIGLDENESVSRRLVFTKRE